MKIGDILTYAYWSCARTPMFVRVTKVTGKSAFVEVLNKKIVEHDGYGQNGKCVPNLDVKAREGIKRFLIKHDSDGEYLKIDDHNAYLWNGEPEEFWSD